MTRILFILENYYPNIGGVETLFKTLAESLAEKGFQVQVLTNRFNKDLPKREWRGDVEIVRLSLGNRYLFTFLAGFMAIKYARHNDIIHTTSYNAALPAFIAGFWTGKKTLITFHEVWGRLWFSLPFMNRAALFLHYCFEQFILRLPFKKFIAVSKFTKESLMKAGIPADKIEHIYNGIQYSEFQAFPVEQSKTYRFCYFGRLGISKGLDIILEAISIAKSLGLEFEFLLILPRSPANFLNKIKGIISQYQIEERIIIKHELDFKDLKLEVLRSNAVVVPSYSEGFCYTAVESLALGTPVISSGKGALKEVVAGRYLEMEEHNADALATCMSKAINNEWRNTPEKQFPLDECIASYIKLYDGLI